jgi:hypothetical protein
VVNEYVEDNPRAESKRNNVINCLYREISNGLTTAAKYSRSSFMGDRMKQFLEQKFKLSNVRFLQARELFNRAKAAG